MGQKNITKSRIKSKVKASRRKVSTRQRTNQRQRVSQRQNVNVVVNVPPRPRARPGLMSKVPPIVKEQNKRDILTSNNEAVKSLQSRLNYEAEVNRTADQKIKLERDKNKLLRDVLFAEAKKKGLGKFLAAPVSSITAVRYMMQTLNVDLRDFANTEPFLALMSALVQNPNLPSSNPAQFNQMVGNIQSLLTDNGFANSTDMAVSSIIQASRNYIRDFTDGQIAQTATTPAPRMFVGQRGSRMALKVSGPTVPGRAPPIKAPIETFADEPYTRRATFKYTSQVGLPSQPPFDTDPQTGGEPESEYEEDP